MLVQKYEHVVALEGKGVVFFRAFCQQVELGCWAEFGYTYAGQKK